MGGSDGRVRLPMQGTQVRSLGQEDPLEKGMATHSSILAWEIPWTEEAGGLQSIRSQKLHMTLNARNRRGPARLHCRCLLF